MTKRDWREHRIMNAGLLGACFAGLLSLDQSSSDVAVEISFYCFAAAIPLLTLGTWAVLTKTVAELETILRQVGPWMLLGTMSGFAGLAAFFWSLSSIIGLIFLGSTVLAVAVGTSCNRVLRIHSESSTKEESSVAEK